MVVGVGIAAPLIAVGAWVLLTPALFPGTVLAAASGLAFGAVDGVALSLVGAVLGGLVASRSRIPARGARSSTPYAVLGQGLGSGSLATILVATASIGLGALAAAVLVRRLRVPAVAN
jgi:hypothetical protein